MSANKNYFYLTAEKLTLKILTSVLEFSFFLSGVKRMVGSINSKDLGGNLGLTGTDL